MEIKATLVLDVSPELIRVLNGFLAALSVSAPSKTGVEVRNIPAKTDGTKNETAIQEKPEQVGKQEKKESVKTGVTIEALRALASKKAKEEGKKDEIRVLLDEFSAGSITNLDESCYADFYAKLKEL